MAYKAAWDSTDQIAHRAVQEGIIDRFGTLDGSDGGDSQRYSLSLEWHHTSEYGLTRLLAYGYYYDLDLFSDFTSSSTILLTVISSNKRTADGSAA